MMNSPGDISCAHTSQISVIGSIHHNHGIFRCTISQHIHVSEDEHKQFAIKSFAKSRKNEERDPAVLLRSKMAFRREYELLTSFRDPENKMAYDRIVSVYQYVDVYPEYGPLFVMELAERSLFDVLKDEAIPTGEDQGQYSFSHCIHFLHQISQALTYLHKGIKFNNEEKSIIHRDLKSCNVLLFKQGTECKLCDFDISKPVEDTMTGGVGTPGWRAPELTTPSREGRLMYTVAADCFSFGAVCLELLFRKTPDKIGKNYSPTDYSNDGEVRFFCEPSDKVASLHESTFKSAAFLHNIPLIKSLLSGLLATNPVERSSARDAQTELENLNSPTVSPLYGPDVAHTARNVDEREVSEAIVIEDATANHFTSTCTPSNFVSVFYTVENSSEQCEFDDTYIDRVLSVMRVMVDTLNTLASVTNEPCTANFCVGLTEEEPNRLILEIKIRQSNQSEVSVVDWCRNNEEKCALQFKSFFAADPKVKLQTLTFRMRTPTMFMPDCKVENCETPVPSLFCRFRNMAGSIVRNFLVAFLSSLFWRD